MPSLITRVMFKTKVCSADEIEANIEDSVMSYGDRDPEEAKDDIHKKNAEKGEGYVEVEVNSNGEEDLKETTATSHSTQLSIAQNIRYLITFELRKVAATRILQSGGCRKI